MPIKTDDPAALEKLDAKLNACIKLQETMKAVNVIVRSSRNDEEKRTLIMNKHHISAESIDDLLHPKQSWQKPGFPGYALTNNNAEIRRLKARIAAVSNYQKEVEKVEETGEMPEFTFAGGRIVDNVPENRIQIFFDSKPEAEIRTRLKQNGFRWSPNNSAWQSFRSVHSLNWAKREFKVEETV